MQNTTVGRFIVPQFVRLLRCGECGDIFVLKIVSFSSLNKIIFCFTLSYSIFILTTNSLEFICKPAVFDSDHVPKSWRLAPLLFRKYLNRPRYIFPTSLASLQFLQKVLQCKLLIFWTTSTYVLTTSLTDTMHIRFEKLFVAWLYLYDTFLQIVLILLRRKGAKIKRADTALF